jgi:hypothetical protein
MKWLQNISNIIVIKAFCLTKDFIEEERETIYEKQMGFTSARIGQDGG